MWRNNYWKTKHLVIMDYQKNFIKYFGRWQSSITTSINYASIKEEPSTSQKTAVIKFIEKKGQTKDLLRTED